MTRRWNVGYFGFKLGWIKSENPMLIILQNGTKMHSWMRILFGRSECFSIAMCWHKYLNSSEKRYCWAIYRGSKSSANHEKWLNTGSNCLCRWKHENVKNITCFEPLKQQPLLCFLIASLIRIKAGFSLTQICMYRGKRTKRKNRLVPEQIAEEYV